MGAAREGGTTRRGFLAGAAQAGAGLAAASAAVGPVSAADGVRQLGPVVVSLDGEWLLDVDPKNQGKAAKWFDAPTPKAVATRVPWIIQDAFPGYHGVAWYWKRFTAPANTVAGGRVILRFWAVDYYGEVWLNGKAVGLHEGGEGMFELDVTAAVKPGEENLLAVRAINPTNEGVDGFVLAQTPHRNKVVPYVAGNAYNHGGITDSVELLVVPAVRVEDLFVRGDPKTGLARVEVTVRNAGKRAASARLEVAVAPAATGETVATVSVERSFPAGHTREPLDVQVAGARPWALNDPFLYRATVRLQARSHARMDERSVRFGFRDFRFERGAFRLNGKRLFLRCSHTGNCCPIGLQFPEDPDWLRRDLLNVKVMGFNAIRFIAGVATRRQLDLCDEIGLMVYEEDYASWCLAESPKMAERFDQGTSDMIRRDRNHPSVVMWGLLNETSDGPLFRHAVASLPLVRKLDDSRVVMLNSGRFDNQTGGGTAGLQWWGTKDGPDPNVTQNPTDHVLTGTGMTWQPGAMAFHPGPHGEYSVVRWTIQVDGEFEVRAEFRGIAEKATTDVHVLHGAASLFDGLINLGGHGNEASYSGKVKVKAGDTIDFVVGQGNGNYGGDSTGLSAVINGGGKTWDGARDFGEKANPAGAWSYGLLAPGARPDASTFRAYTERKVEDAKGIGSLCNPGSASWEDVLTDIHPYQRVPHTAAIVHTLRTIGAGPIPVFISEYGIGSAVDLVRAARWYEQLGNTSVEDAKFYRDKLDRFLADWKRWHMEEAFGRPEDFFAESNARMGAQRLLGLNAIRANPNCIGHSVTGTVDQGMTGEGLFTTFRELKPGTLDAVFEGWAPLRLCLFAEPVNVYRGAKVRLEAVLANEDALKPGAYSLLLHVFGPARRAVWDKRVAVRVPGAIGGRDPAFAMPVFAEDVAIDGPAGAYRFCGSFESGAAAAGGDTLLYVDDAATMPKVEAEVALWGQDAELEQWLRSRGIRAAAFDVAKPAGSILVLPGAPPDWAPLWQAVDRGATAVVLVPDALRVGDDSTARLPLKNRPTVRGMGCWLYHKDDWAKPHAIFEGLPSGGLMDYTFYRDLIPDIVFSGIDAPDEAVAGANDCSYDYSAGLHIAVYRHGKGRIVLNTLRVRETLGAYPPAERLLRNLLRFTAAR